MFLRSISVRRAFCIALVMLSCFAGRISAQQNGHYLQGIVSSDAINAFGEVTANFRCIYQGKRCSVGFYAGVLDRSPVYFFTPRYKTLATSVIKERS
jgi:hypothetical protein